MKITNKLRGGYYTPAVIADLITAWAIENKKCPAVLEPSMGDGIFVESLLKILSKTISEDEIGKNVFGIELIDDEVKKAKERIVKFGFNPKKFNFKTGDYFLHHQSILKNKKFDAIIGNPPFIRYQTFPKECRERAMKILNSYGFKPNKLTNAWLFFLLATANLLKKDGRLAMVIPAELLQVKYAAEARLFLSKYFHSINIISFKKLVFKGIQQEVVLLLADKSKRSPAGISLIDIENLDSLKDAIDSHKHISSFKPIDHTTDKWTQYFLESDEIMLLKKLLDSKPLRRLGDLVDVDVGVVTGNNEFFAIDESTVSKYALNNHTVKLVGRSAHLNGGIVFHEKDWEKAIYDGFPTYLLDIKDFDRQHVGLKEYIQLGEEQGVHEGYKCSIRKQWYTVPSIWVPDLFMLRQIHHYPRFILNKANAVPTDTIHRVKVFNRAHVENITVSFMNSLTFAFSEVFGRSYGGGVLELEPNESEELPIPFFPDLELDLKKADKFIRNKKVNELLDYTDQVLLKEKLGLTQTQIMKLRNIWEKLSSRRLNRK